tara:strand:+ start:1339 stop:3441 length:2103 start_codon:yes stop_codon:yes gene_type:complete
VGTNDLTIRNGWFARVLRALSLVDVKDDGTTTHVAGSDFVNAYASRPDYSQLNSMSALAAFPWVRACVDAIASEITKLPIRAISGRGVDAVTVEDHPVLDLLERPSSRVSGILMRRQLVTDLALTGNAYLLIGGSPEPRALIRLHPERMRIIPSADGQPAEYEHDGHGNVTRYGFDQVLHIRNTSWSANPSNLYGTGAIQALHNDLMTDLAASKLAAESAETGLPTGILSPSEEGDRWTQNQIKQLREGFEKQLKAKSGTVILGAGVDYRQVSQTLRDMEYQNTRLMAREAVLAAFGVPPVVVGLPNANFATAQAQRRQFAESIQAKAAQIDSELTRLARMFPDSDSVRIVHDFAEVDALQESRTERVNRVQSWYFMGLPLADAAALEGFDELNANDIEPEPVEDEPEPQTESLIRLMCDDDEAEPVTRWLSDDVQTMDMETAEGRDAVWRNFINKVQGPGEKRLAALTRKYLRQYGARVATRFEKHTPQGKGVKRSIDSVALDKILDVALETQEIARVLLPTYRMILQRSLLEAYRTIDLDAGIDPQRIQEAANAEVLRMTRQIQATTSDQVAAILQDGFSQGASIAEIQTNLVQSSAFSPQRALTIARTEATRLANQGAADGYREAERLGIELEKQWLHSRDEKVRDSHRELEAKGWIPLNAPFESRGSLADVPGGFGVGREDINCRCTIVSRRVKKK